MTGGAKEVYTKDVCKYYDLVEKESVNAVGAFCRVAANFCAFIPATPCVESAFSITNGIHSMRRHALRSSFIKACLMQGKIHRSFEEVRNWAEKSKHLQAVFKADTHKRTDQRMKVNFCK